MPNIPQETIIAVSAAIIVWLFAQVALVLQNIWQSYKASRKTEPGVYELHRIFEMGWAAGEQLIEKHGITDRAEVEARVLKFANQYMIQSGFTPPQREFAEMLIKAVGREYNRNRGK